MKNLTIPSRGSHERRIVLAMSKGLGLVIAGLMTASMLVAAPGAAPASADTPGCVTLREFRQVDATVYTANPVTMRRAHQIFDTRGKVVHKASGLRTRIYRGCANGRARAWAEFAINDGRYRIDSTARTVAF